MRCTQKETIKMKFIIYFNNKIKMKLNLKLIKYIIIMKWYRNKEMTCFVSFLGLNKRLKIINLLKVMKYLRT